MLFIEKSSDVLFVDQLPLTLLQNDFALLRRKADVNKRRQARLCMHTEESSNLHEMIICYSDKVYVRPHKQEKKIVSYHFIKGEADLYLFHDDGSIKKIIKMGEFSSGYPFYFRSPSDTYRSMIVTSPYLIFHEVTQGPYYPHETIFASWAPNEYEEQNIHIYQEYLKKKDGKE